MSDDGDDTQKSPESEGLDEISEEVDKMSESDDLEALLADDSEPSAESEGSAEAVPSVGDPTLLKGAPLGESVSEESSTQQSKRKSKVFSRKLTLVATVALCLAGVFYIQWKFGHKVSHWIHRDKETAKVPGTASGKGDTQRPSDYKPYAATGTAYEKDEVPKEREPSSKFDLFGFFSGKTNEASDQNFVSSEKRRLGSLGSRKRCSSLEFPGEGPTSVVADHHWAQVVTFTKEAKRSLLSWLRAHRSHFTSKEYHVMEGLVNDLRVARPPYRDEPDLAWRGIGVRHFNPKSMKSEIRLGNGFFSLVKKNSDWAKFELTRLVAMSWTPCELERRGIEGTWGSLLSCLGYENKKSCIDGSYSEAGWAVSSALGVTLSNPGCRIPAFSTAGGEKCIRAFPLSRKLANKSKAKAVKKAKRTE